jgi:glycopeptide antibiotics resistance protein
MRLLNILTRVIMISLSFIYILFVVRTLFLNDRINGFYLMGYDYNLIPFKTIATYITRYNHYNFNTWFNNLFGNIILFIPFGFSTLYFLRKLRYFKSFVLFILAVTVILEMSQMLLHVGSLDIDDVILNSIGGIIGFVFYKMCFALLQKFKFFYNSVSASNAG